MKKMSEREKRMVREHAHEHLSNIQEAAKELGYMNLLARRLKDEDATIDEILKELDAFDGGS